MTPKTGAIPPRMGWCPNRKLAMMVSVGYDAMGSEVTPKADTTPTRWDRGSRIAVTGTRWSVRTVVGDGFAGGRRERPASPVSSGFRRPCFDGPINSGIKQVADGGSGDGCGSVVSDVHVRQRAAGSERGGVRKTGWARDVGMIEGGGVAETKGEVFGAVGVRFGPERSTLVPELVPTLCP